MGLWWFEPGWTETLCARCGARIHPEGDPDWGLCLPCFDEQLNHEQQMREQEAAEMQARVEAENAAQAGEGV